MKILKLFYHTLVVISAAYAVSWYADNWAVLCLFAVPLVGSGIALCISIVKGINRIVLNDYVGVHTEEPPVRYAGVPEGMSLSDYIIEPIKRFRGAV